MMTVRDFTQVFDSYAQFEESMIAAKMETTSELGHEEEGEPPGSLGWCGGGAQVAQGGSRAMVSWGQSGQQGGGRVDSAVGPLARSWELGYSLGMGCTLARREAWADGRGGSGGPGPELGRKGWLRRG